MLSEIEPAAPRSGPPRPDVAPRRAGRVEELQRQVERLMPRMRIAVIYGGDGATEGAVINRTANPRSWESCRAVAEDIAAALERIGFRHVRTLPEDMRLADRLRRGAVHMAWLNTGGVQGYNPMSHAAALLEMLGVPYVGHDPLTAGTLDNKHVLKRDLALLGIPTAPSAVWHPARGPFVPATNRRFIESFRGYDGPFVVKPVCGRASLHVRVVEDATGLTGAVAEVYGATHNHVLIEEFLPGREFCVAVSGPVTARGGRLARERGPFVFAAVERVLGAGERIFTPTDVRPITAERVRALDPAADADRIAGLHRLAREVFVELSVETLIRLDVRADATGRMFVLEANPKPDLRAPGADRTGLVCAGLAPHGMTYDDLVLSLLADRLDLLFSRRRGTVSHLTALLA